MYGFTTTPTGMAFNQALEERTLIGLRGKPEAAVARRYLLSAWARLSGNGAPVRAV